MGDHVAEGRGAPADRSNVGQHIRRYGARWAEPAGFRRVVADQLLRALASDAIRGSLERRFGG